MLACPLLFIIPCLDGLFQGTPPLCAVSCKALPGQCRSRQPSCILRRHLYIAGEARATGGSPPQCQLTVYIEDVFWSATILHTADMTQPSQSASSKQSACVHAGKTSTRQDIRAGYLVLPGYAQDMADASQVECVESSLLPAICCTCLALIYVLATHAL